MQLKSLLQLYKPQENIEKFLTRARASVDSRLIITEIIYHQEIMPEGWKPTFRLSFV
jgi:hypothetical protein